MKRYLLSAVLVLAAVAPAFGQCNANVQAFSTTNIAVTELGNCDIGTPAVGDSVSITAEGESIATTVVKFKGPIKTATASIGGSLQLASVDPSPDKLQLINDGGTVTVKVDDKTITAQVLSPKPNYFKYDWSIGPATSGDAEGKSNSSSSAAAVTASDTSSTSSTADSGAIRFKYSAEYASSGMFGTKVGTAQTTATLDIDTTDQNDPSFIDNNRATLGFEWDLPPAGNLFKQGELGFQGRASKSAHQDIHDLDAAITFSGWLPVIRTLNLFNRGGDFISAPLSFTASYGYRNRNQQDDTFHGKVFEATALYHVFAIDRYKVDFNGTWTINDLSNRPATTPRTQRLYKATISYLVDPAKGFSMLTSFEDGSAGVMLTKVRQYFIGLALSKVNFSGSSP
jgi:hypothetical protein